MWRIGHLVSTLLNCLTIIVIGNHIFDWITHILLLSGRYNVNYEKTREVIGQFQSNFRFVRILIMNYRLFFFSHSVRIVFCMLDCQTVSTLNEDCLWLD